MLCSFAFLFVANVFITRAVRAQTDFGSWKDNAWGTLKTSIGPSESSIVLSTGHGARFPESGKFWVKLTTQPTDFRVVGERVAVAARSGDTLDVTGGRGEDGTEACSWGAGSTYVLQTVSAADMARIGGAINALEMSSFVDADGAVAAVSESTILEYCPDSEGTTGQVWASDGSGKGGWLTWIIDLATQVTGQLPSSNLTTAFASPPALGGTAPAAGSMTDLTLTGDVAVNGGDVTSTGAMRITSNASTGGHIIITPRTGYQVFFVTNGTRFGGASETFASQVFYGGGGDTGNKRFRQLYYGTTGLFEWQKLQDAADTWVSTLMALNAVGDLTLTGDAAINGGDITSTASTFNLVNSPTTVNAFTGSTTSTLFADNGTVTLNGKIKPDNLFITAAAPASNTSTGEVGEIRYSEDGAYVYKCVATNTWARAATSASTSW